MEALFSFLMAFFAPWLNNHQVTSSNYSFQPHRKIYQNTNDIPEQNGPKKNIRVKLYYLTFPQYDTLVKYDIDEIKGAVTEICTLEVNPEWQLDDTRKLIEAKKVSGVRINNKAGE